VLARCPRDFGYVGPSRCCSRCWLRVGPRPPSPRTRSDGACTSAATCGNASVTC
jgi:hypothetical protein